MDYFFPLFPNLTRDKFHWFSRYVQGSFLAGAAFVLFVYHTPFAGADYDHDFKSWSYLRKRDRLIESGQLAENLRVKYHSLYHQPEE
jgi:hypothetical protein